MVRADLGIVGGGPGGYVAALRAAQLGLRVILFERDRVGGLCLNWGCIPTKALLRNADAVEVVRDAERWGIHAPGASWDLGAAVDRSRSVVDQLVGGVEGLLRDAGVEVVNAAAAFVTPSTLAAGGIEYEVGAAIIATGAGSKSLPGIEPDGKAIITSREALALRELPGRVVVIGGGPVGVEFAHLWATYGATVTIVELLDTLLPAEDPDCGRALARSFAARGIETLTGTRVAAVGSGPGAPATATVSGKGGERQLEADRVLLAVGFTPHSEGLNLEGIGVKTERGFIAIDDNMETNVPGVFAVGDVTGKLMLAHVASAQGEIAAERVAGRRPPAVDYIQMPRATFCQPQVGSIGYSERAAKEAGYEVRAGRFPLTALGRAIVSGHTEGFVKVIADAPTGQVLGVSMVGHDIVDLLGEASLASLLEATTVELGFAVHAHPTLSEALREAALAVDGRAIHVARRRAERATVDGAEAR